MSEIFDANSAVPRHPSMSDPDYMAEVLYPAFPTADDADITDIPVTDDAVEGEVIDMMPSETDEHLTYRERFRRLRKAGAEDFGRSGPLHKIGMIATAGIIAYEWGPGNETVTPIIAGIVINNTDGPKGILLSAGIAGAFTIVEQGLATTLMASTVSQFPELAKTSMELSGTDEDPVLRRKPWKELSRRKRLLSGFTLGASYVVPREAAITGNADFKQNLKVGLKSTAMTGGVVAAFAGGVDTIDQVTDNAPAAVETIGDIAVTVVTHPALWLGIFGLTVYSEHRARKQYLAQRAGQPASS